MKKILFSLLALSFLTSFSLAACPYDNCNKSDCNCDKAPVMSDCNKPKKACDIIDDDEYCTYNQCYFDKKYKNMKKELCLTSKQECQIDIIYKNFKHDMENLHSRYTAQKNKVLEMIACSNDCYKDEAKVLKQIGKEAKQKCKDFRNDVKEQLCKDQYAPFRKYQRQEKRKLKKICKYGKIVKLPCIDYCR